MTKKKEFGDLSLKGDFYQEHVFSNLFIDNLRDAHGLSAVENLEGILSAAYIKFITLNKQKQKSTINN